MSYLSIVNIKNEFLNFLRNSNIYSVAERGVTTSSNVTSITALPQTITLSATLKNVRSVTNTTQATTLKLGVNYTLDLDAGTITITSGAVGTDSITTSYDAGATDKIFPDYPRPNLTITSFPRCGFDIYSWSSDTGGFGNVNVTDLDMNISLYEYADDTVVASHGRKRIEQRMDTLRQSIITGQTNFYYLSYIKPRNVRAVTLLDTDKGKGKIYMMSMDVSSRNNYEIN